MKTPIEILQKLGGRYDTVEDFDIALDILTTEIGKIQYINLTPLQEGILAWAKDKKLLPQRREEGKQIAFKQLAKLQEEIGELAHALIHGDEEALIDAFGDVQVVLIILAEQLFVDYNKALSVAYNTIKHRKGISVNGLFIKENT